MLLPSPPPPPPPPRSIVVSRLPIISSRTAHSCILSISPSSPPSPLDPIQPIQCWPLHTALRSSLLSPRHNDQLPCPRSPSASLPHIPFSFLMVGPAALPKRLPARPPACRIFPTSHWLTNLLFPPVTPPITHHPADCAPAHSHSGISPANCNLRGCRLRTPSSPCTVYTHTLTRTRTRTRTHLDYDDVDMLDITLDTVFPVSSPLRPPFPSSTIDPFRSARGRSCVRPATRLQEDLESDRRSQSAGPARLVLVSLAMLLRRPCPRRGVDPCQTPEEKNCSNVPATTYHRHSITFKPFILDPTLPVDHAVPKE